VLKGGNIFVIYVFRRFFVLLLSMEDKKLDELIPPKQQKLPTAGLSLNLTPFIVVMTIVATAVVVNRLVK